MAYRTPHAGQAALVLEAQLFGPDGMALGPDSPMSVGGLSFVAAASFQRPANTTAYAAGQLVANSVTAAQVVPLALAAARKPGGTGLVVRCRLTKSTPMLTNAGFRVHLYRSAPVTANGDGGAWSTDSALQYLGACDVAMDKAFTDGAKGVGAPNVGSQIVFDTAPAVTSLYALVEARAAYIPASAETFTVALELLRD